MAARVNTGKNPTGRRRTCPPYPPSSTSRPGAPQLEDLRRREKAATRELDAIAAQRRRLPMVEMEKYVLIGADGPVSLAECSTAVRS